MLFPRRDLILCENLGLFCGMSARFLIGALFQALCIAAARHGASARDWRWHSSEGSGMAHDGGDGVICDDGTVATALPFAILWVFPVRK
jgi:hypothetical protein